MSEYTQPSDTYKSAVVALYNTHEDAEKAVRTLQRSGCDMTKLSIVGKDYQTEEHIAGYYHTGDRMYAWGKWGAFWGGLWGFLLGSAFFVLPGLGHILIAGPLVYGIASGLEGAALTGGLSALAAGLVSIGIPEDSVLQYETQVKAGKFLLILYGTAAEVIAARSILELSNHEGVQEHTNPPSETAVAV